MVVCFGSVHLPQSLFHSLTIEKLTGIFFVKGFLFVQLLGTLSILFIILMRGPEKPKKTPQKCPSKYHSGSRVSWSSGVWRVNFEGIWMDDPGVSLAPQWSALGCSAVSKGWFGTNTLHYPRHPWVSPHIHHWYKATPLECHWDTTEIPLVIFTRDINQSVDFQAFHLTCTKFLPKISFLVIYLL
jgi:hypothetical protein